MNLYPNFRYSLFEREQIAWENGAKTVYNICSELGLEDPNQNRAPDRHSVDVQPKTKCPIRKTEYRCIT